MQWVHTTISLKSKLSGVKDVELKPPVEASGNKNNISIMERAILDAYVGKDDSLFSLPKKSPFWGIMHDGIVKFSTEYNGVFLRGVNMDTYEPIFLP